MFHIETVNSLGKQIYIECKLHYCVCCVYINFAWHNIVLGIFLRIYRVQINSINDMICKKWIVRRYPPEWVTPTET